MKKLLLLLAIVFVFSCTWTQMTYEQSICVNRPAEYVDSSSWICEASYKANIAPEEIDNFLLDATAMLYISEAITREKVKDLIEETRERTDNNCARLTYTELLDGIFDDAVKLQLSLNILSRRLNLYYSNKPVSDFDCWLINKAIDHQSEQFGI